MILLKTASVDRSWIEDPSVWRSPGWPERAVRLYPRQRGIAKSIVSNAIEDEQER